MRLVNFSATQVHDYLDFDITFRKDVSFLAGLNGAGKTTAIKLIMALLSPSLKVLNEVQYKACSITFESDHDEKNRVYQITCTKYDTFCELSLLKDGVLFETQVVDSMRQHPELARPDSKQQVVNEILNLPVPMFIGLDRINSLNSKKHLKDIRFTHEIKNTVQKRPKTFEVGNIDIALDLIRRGYSKARNKQLDLDIKLREQILLSSLEFNPQDIQIAPPTSKDIKLIRKRLDKITDTLSKLNISTESLQSFYEAYLERMNTLAELVNSDDKNKADELKFSKLLVEWLANHGQLYRINKLSAIIENFDKKKKAHFNELTTFENLVNNFLKETDKEIVINNTDQPKIKINGKLKDIKLLSSGESQILIMLAQLVFNEDLPKNGVLIIDEPELSLHLTWQEMFVESIQAANPELQIILATHSPAIICGRNHMYVPLKKEVVDVNNS